MIVRILHSLHRTRRGLRLLALSLSLVLVPLYPAHGQSSLSKRLDRVLDQPPFNRANWGVVLMDSAGKVLFERNADRFFIPASNTKLVVGAVASALLPPDYVAHTSVYGAGVLEEGVLRGDLVIYGRGDPTASRRCYGLDTLAAGACDSLWTRVDAIADSLVARGVQHVAGAIVGDGSFFETRTVHEAWETYDLNWWYAAPVSGLGFNDNSINLTWRAGPRVGAPAVITYEPDLGYFQFENRTRTVLAGERRTIDFFREPGTMRLWAEGTVPEDTTSRREYFALPDPNQYFAVALRAALARRGVSVAGPTLSTTDSTRYGDARQTPALATVHSRPLTDLLFPILNSSQNWFAETLLKLLGREKLGEGSWDAGLKVERQFLVDSIRLDSTAFSLSDGSGLATGNLATPRAFAQILVFTWRHPNRAAFLRALPRAGQAGSLKDRFRGSPLDGRVVAKTGSIRHVNALSGYVERARGGPLVFSILVNNHTARYADALRQIDSVVVEMVK